MPRRPPSMRALQAFEAAARLGSFSAAAKELALTPGAVGYQVRRLEGGLDAALFHRRTREVALTDAGRSLYGVARRLLRELDAEINRLFPDTDGGILTVAVSTYFVTRWLSRRLGEFLNAEPGITLRLQHSVNDPDFAFGEVDMAIRWGDGQWPGTRAECLMAMPMQVFCAPRLLQGASALRSVADVPGATLLHDQPGIDYWPQWLRAAGLDAAAGAAGPVIADPNVRVQSAVDGHGLVLGNPLMQPEVDAGRLASPFDVRLEGYGYHLVFKRGVEPSRACRTFRQWLLEQVNAERSAGTG